MNEQELSQVKAEYAGTYFYFKHEAMPDLVLKMYVNDIADLPFRGVMTALAILRRDPKRDRPPKPGEIRAMLVKSQDTVDCTAEANRIAGCIVSAVGLIGYQRPALARERLGEIAWRVVNAKGGWCEICSSLKANDNSFFAQCRDLAHTFIIEERNLSILQNTSTCFKEFPPAQLTSGQGAS